MKLNNLVKKAFVLTLSLSILCTPIVVCAKAMDLPNGSTLLKEPEESLEKALNTDDLTDKSDEKKGFEDDKLSVAKDALKSAKELLDSKEATKEDIEKMSDAFYKAEAGLSDVYSKLLKYDSGIQVRSANWDVVNQKVWFGATDKDLGYAKNGINIQKEIDYDTNSIHWTVDFNDSYTQKTWTWPFYYIFMPNHVGEVVIHKSAGAPVVKESDFNGQNNRWNHKNPSTEYKREFENRVIKHIPNDMPEIKSNLNWLKDSFLSNVLISREGTINTRYTWTFTTKHTPGTVLEKVPMVVGAYGDGAAPNSWPRGLAIGTFGIALRHHIPIPEKIYVNNPDSLTPYEKSVVRKRILEKVLEAYKKDKSPPHGKKKELVEFFNINVFLTVNGVETPIRYEEYNGGTNLRLVDGKGNEITDLSTIDMVRDKNGMPDMIPLNRVNISNDGRFTISFDDWTFLTLDPSLYIAKKELKVQPLKQEVLDKEKVSEISITALGYDAFAIDPTTPGLTLTKNKDNTAKITGTIENVIFPEGQDSVTYKFKVKAEDAENSMSVTKEVSITVKKNPGLVPVGVNERGYNLPIIVLSLGALACLVSIYNLKKRGLRDSA